MFASAGADGGGPWLVAGGAATAPALLHALRPAARRGRLQDVLQRALRPARPLGEAPAAL